LVIKTLDLDPLLEKMLDPYPGPRFKSMRIRNPGKQFGRNVFGKQSRNIFLLEMYFPQTKPSVA
jgi:hypothetical protein